MSEQERAEAKVLAQENAVLRQAIGALHWMARRYADGRTSTVTADLNALTRVLLSMGIDLSWQTAGTPWARDAMGRKYDGLSDEEAALGWKAP